MLYVHNELPLVSLSVGVGASLWSKSTAACNEAGLSFKAFNSLARSSMKADGQILAEILVASYKPDFSLANDWSCPSEELR